MRVKQKILLCVLAVTALLSGCANKTLPETDYVRSNFTRDVGAVDYSGIKYTPWDVESAVEQTGTHERANYTVLVYMNGSDLESEEGAATADLIEMLKSDVDTERVNVIIFTGGAYRWRNDAVPPDDCVIWRLEDGGIRELCRVGLRSMGDAGTLSGFISFGLQSFPAEQYGLIFWDHGGGTIAGYGHDELFNDSCLTLLEMDYAFMQSGLEPRGLEFIGFDACLMATAEMAVVASGYARYLIASEDLEPGDGWDYGFLSVLNESPDGEIVGRAVADSYIKFYGNGTTESVTMSVTDLEHAGAVMGAMGTLMSKCSVLLEDDQGAFAELSKRRYRTKTFGGGTRRDSDCDMVDVLNMADRLSDVFPSEALALRAALREAVVYNRHNSLTDLGGLTAFYIYGGKNNAVNTLGTYSSLKMSSEYTDYLLRFAEVINSEDTGSETLETKTTLWKTDAVGTRYMSGQRISGDGDLWPVIGGLNVCMYAIGQSDAGEEYAVPVNINGLDADLIIEFDDTCPEGRIIGTRREDGYIIQKGVDKLKDGDELAFYYRTEEPGNWLLSGTITVSSTTKLEWTEPDGEHYTRTVTKDTKLSERLSDFQNISE